MRRWKYPRPPGVEGSPWWFLGGGSTAMRRKRGLGKGGERSRRARGAGRRAYRFMIYTFSRHLFHRSTYIRLALQQIYAGAVCAEKGLNCNEDCALVRAQELRELWARMPSDSFWLLATEGTPPSTGRLPGSVNIAMTS
jgi:hypothetical protein